MTEPVRVTPQAVQAAKVAISDAWWEGAGHHDLAAAALTAAVPLLCQPLQDEIDRLRADNERISGAWAEVIQREQRSENAYAYDLNALQDENERLRRAIVDAVAVCANGTSYGLAHRIHEHLTAALAAVPVGTE